MFQSSDLIRSHQETTMATTQPRLHAARTTRRVPLSIVVSAWSVPVLIVGQFAMLAVVPVAVVLVGALRDRRLRALRWWAAALAGAYATPLILWAVGPDRAPSLSKDMEPGLAALVVAAAAAVIVAVHVIGRRP
jgi:drug/metabolite transporter (DMT)-like permease